MEASNIYFAEQSQTLGLIRAGLSMGFSKTALEGHPDILASAIQWGESVEGTAQEILSKAEESTEEDRSALQEAKDYLIETLSGGALSVSEINEGAELNSISERTLKRAKIALGIKHKKKGLVWFWSLPEQVSQTAPTENLGSLGAHGSLDGSSVNDDSRSTRPTEPTRPSEPTEPTKNMEQLLERRAALFAEKVNEIIARGFKGMAVR